MKVENFISNATALAARSSSSEGAPAPPSDTSNYSSLGTFDFVSVCPPYKKVDYVDMLDNLSKSPLISGSSYVMIEFPSEDRDLIMDELGPLLKLKERKYGRTILVIYGPPE